MNCYWPVEIPTKETNETKSFGFWGKIAWQFKNAKHVNTVFQIQLFFSHVLIYIVALNNGNEKIYENAAGKGSNLNLHSLRVIKIIVICPYPHENSYNFQAWYWKLHFRKTIFRASQRPKRKELEFFWDTRHLLETSTELRPQLSSESVFGLIDWLVYVRQTGRQTDKVRQIQTDKDKQRPTDREKDKVWKKDKKHT